MSSLDHVDRRRLVVATAITVIALPSLWLSSRADDSTAPNVATAGVVVSADGESTPAGGPDDSVVGAPDALGAPGGAFLELPEVPLPSARADDAERTARIATAASPGRNVITGRASFRASLGSSDVCAVTGAPYGVRVRVKNLDNGHSITCVASVSTIGMTTDAVLHTDAFAQVALLADAPVPVEISW